MIYKLTSFALFVALFSVGLAQNTIGTTVFQPDLVDDGYTLLYPHNQPHVYLLDFCGEVVHTWTNEDTLRPGNMAYLQENGDLILTYRPQVFSNDPIWAGGGGATVERRTWDNETLWSFTLNDSTARLHHDIEVKPDGNVFAIAWEHFTPAEALEAGRDTSLIPEEGLWSEMILELSPNGGGGADVVWGWHAWDHLVQDFDETKSNFGVVSESVQKIDLNYGTPSVQASDWLHINAIDYNPYFQHLMLSVPTFNELWIVDYDNFTPGQLLWRWGNPEAYDMGTSEDQQLFYQHDCHWVYDHVTLANPDFGKIAVFNNRVPDEDGEPYSAVHLLNPSYTDYDNTFGSSEGTYLPDTFDWSYVPQDSLYSSGLSSFQRLENGNSLICFGRWGDTREVTPEGELAWRYKTPLVNAGGFASPVAQGSVPNINQNMTFRAHRYPTEFTAFQGVDLTPQGPLELDPTPLMSCAGVIEGCMNSLACNFDSTATAPGPCEFFSASYGSGLEFVIGLVDDELGCDGGYAVSQSLPIGLVATENGMMWSLDEDVEAILIEEGFELVVADLNTQLVSFCGDDMNVLDAAGNEYSLQYDGTGYINGFFENYFAPAENFELGCGLETACNYNPCALAVDSLCSDMVGVLSTNDATGFLSLDVDGGIPPYNFELLDGDLNPTGINGGTGNASIAWDGLPEGAYCVEVTDAAGCMEVFCDSLGVADGVHNFVHMDWQLFPNPTQDVLQVQLEAAQPCQLAIFDVGGREVMTFRLTQTATALDVSALQAGFYHVQLNHNGITRSRNLQVAR